MKRNPALLIYCFLILLSISTKAQQSPLWTRNLTALPDTADLFPVKTLLDANADILVLCNYTDYRIPQAPVNKIFLSKYNPDGILLWNMYFDNGGTTPALAYDMALDDMGNCYIAGAFSNVPTLKPLLLKVDQSGTEVWYKDSSASFNSGSNLQVLYQSGMLYLRHEYGIALFDTSGTEQWSLPVSGSCMTTDRAGRMLVVAYTSGPNTIFRYDLNGTPDLSAPTTYAERIACDSENNIYVFAQQPAYELMKYDSNGVFLWAEYDFPLNLSFGDIGFEMLVDLYDDVILIGLSDTMYKFRKDGLQRWKKSMDGLDSYRLDAEIVFSNFIAVAGTIQTPQGSDVKIAIYDMFGNRNWQGIYNSNTQQEYAVSLTVAVSGIYLLEDSISNAGLLKFESPVFSLPVDYSFVCVDSVWYEPGFPNLINVRVFNGNFAHMNYPSVQIISPAGDTIGNPDNIVNFFAHLGNYLQEYQDSISQSGINDFSDYTFLMNELFGDTGAVIDWCSATGMDENNFTRNFIYPNPAANSIFFANVRNEFVVEIFSTDGRLVLTETIKEGEGQMLDISAIRGGLYIVRMREGTGTSFRRLIKVN